MKANDSSVMTGQENSDKQAIPSTQEARDRLLCDIRLVLFDFDGVFTDNRVMVSQDGTESVACWRSDGIGLASLRTCGVDSVIVSGEHNHVVSARARKLGLECIAGCANKLDVVKSLLEDRNIDPQCVAFVGNDTPDIEAMDFVGVSIAVADAYPEVRRCARLVTTAPGGYGAVREICDWLIGAKATSKRKF